MLSPQRNTPAITARFVDDKLESALEVLADMVINSSFSTEAISTEREVVLEEIARSEDTPDDYVFELFNQSMIIDHALGLPVLGIRGLFQAMNMLIAYPSMISTMALATYVLLQQEILITMRSLNLHKPIFLQ